MKKNTNKATIWIVSITGIPIENSGFSVLCLNVFIARRHPIEPPSKAKVKSVASGIRHFERVERLLSIKNAINPPRLTERIYSETI